MVRYEKDDLQPWKRLAAAVIESGMLVHASGLPESHLSAEDRRQDVGATALFLQGDMFPYAEMIGMDPETDLSYRQWCRKHGLEAGKLIGKKV